MDFKIGDKVRCIYNSKAQGQAGSGWKQDLVFVINDIDYASEGPRAILWGKNTENGNGVFAEWVEHVSSSEIPSNKNMTKRIFQVVAVDKKSNKITKNETVTADTEQLAVLGAFGVKADSLHIQVTQTGSYEEEKPIKAVLEKKE